jgi:chorismate dehydratase
MTWKIGAVPYLNAKPLIYGIESKIQLDVPSLLSSKLREGQLDAGLVPIAEYFECPKYQIVPRIAIATRGAVRSVYLAYKMPLAKLKTITLDPASKTSNMLLKVILLEFFNLKLKYVQSEEGADGQLFIGDPALQNRKRLIEEGFHLLDLGETWFEQTNLPFVFAIWAIHPNISAAEALIQELTKAKENGLSNIDSIAEDQQILPPEAARDYLKRCISFEFGEKEALGIKKFQELCLQHGLISQKCELKMTS